MSEYEFTDEMGEISGFGDDLPSYEEACRAMVTTGAEWLDENPDADPGFAELQADGMSFFGVIKEKNGDAAALVEAMTDAAKEAGGESPTGAMVHAAVSHVMWIDENGWDAYVEKMTG